MSQETITDFKHFIRLIGRGQRAGRTLTVQEAEQAMSMLIKGQLSAEQKGAFLMLLRVREESPEELAGFTRAFRACTEPQLSQLAVDVDMGCYAGKRRHLPWFLLAALVLAQQGKRLFLHGTHEPDSKRLYLKEVLPQLGLPICYSAEEVKQQLDSIGLAYMDLPQINPPLEQIIQLREQFGLRSCANTLARMLNPSQAPFSLQGVFHRNVDDKHRETAVLLNEPNVLCFRGEGGELEFNPERDVSLHLARQGEQQIIDVTATAANWVTKPKELDPLHMLAVWQGEQTDPYAELAIVGTLALMLVLTEQRDWPAAYQQAEALWLGRNRQWPVAIPTQHSSKAFSTEGRFYAH